MTARKPSGGTSPGRRRPELYAGRFAPARKRPGEGGAKRRLREDFMKRALRPHLLRQEGNLGLAGARCQSPGRFAQKKIGNYSIKYFIKFYTHISMRKLSQNRGDIYVNLTKWQSPGKNAFLRFCRRAGARSEAGAGHKAGNAPGGALRLILSLLAAFWAAGKEEKYFITPFLL